MNHTQDMILYMQTQMLAKLQSAGGKKPAAHRSEERESFQDLLNQKGQAGAEKPQTPAAEKPQSPTEKPEVPTDEPQDSDGLDPYRQQLLAAAQAAAMAVPVLTAEPIPQMPETQPVAAVQSAPANQEQVTGTMPTLKPEGGGEPAQVTVAYGQAQVGANVRPEETALPQAQSAELTQTKKGEPVQVLPQQSGQATAVTPTAIRQTPGSETGADSAQPELQKNTEPGKETEVTGAQAAPEQVLFRQVEAAPVKVGDAPVVDTQAPDVEAQLAKQVDTLLAKGGDRVELRLNPASLGAVTVELTRSQDGAIHVALAAGSEKALAILEKHAAGLESALLNSNRVPVQVEVQRNQDSQQSQSQQQTYDREGHGQQEQQQRQPQRDNSQDFLQQLRLGLFPVEGEAS